MRITCSLAKTGLSVAGVLPRSVWALMPEHKLQLSPLSAGSHFAGTLAL